MAKSDSKLETHAPKEKVGGKTIKVEKTTQTADRLKLAKPKPKPSQFNATSEGADFRHIVRIANRDIPGYMSIADGIDLIYGIGKRTSKVIEGIFLDETGKATNKIGHLSDEDVTKIESIIAHLDKHAPAWLLNRPKERAGSKGEYTMADLKLVERKELLRLSKIKSYRGLRLQWGLRVRGQKTRSTGRKHSTVGVSKAK